MTATYTGMMDEIRKVFAKANGVKPALFSANSEGACPTCNGLGVIYTDLAFLDQIATPCESCEGTRYVDEVLELPAARESTSPRCWPLSAHGGGRLLHREAGPARAARRWSTSASATCPSARP